MTTQQQAMEDKRKRDKKELAIKEQQIALDREAEKEKREEAANKKAEQDEETRGINGEPIPTDSASGRRPGRNAEEEDDKEKERANKQQGVGSPMRTNNRSPRRDLPKSLIRVEEVDMSIEGSGGDNGGKQQSDSILRNWLVTKHPHKGGGSGTRAASTSSRTGGSVNTNSSSRSRVRAKGLKEQNMPTTSLKWGRNTTQTFVLGEGDDNNMEDITPGGDDGDKAK